MEMVVRSSVSILSRRRMEKVHLTEALKDVSGKLDDVLTAAQSLEE
ncbi:hypothetical protein [Gracilibacillus sp. Marseille-QA3620]